MMAMATATRFMGGSSVMPLSVRRLLASDTNFQRGPRLYRFEIREKPSPASR